MKRPHRQLGFTLLETLIVLGLLTSFCLFLAQILRTGVTLFGEGEIGQDLSDRAHNAASAVEDSLHAMLGPTRDLDEGQPPEARLFLTAVFGPNAPAKTAAPKGSAAGAAAAKPPYPFLVSSVRLDADQETALLVKRFRDEVRATLRGKSETEIDIKVREALRDAPRSGRGAMWLFAHPQGDPEQAYLEIRRRLFLGGQRAPVLGPGGVEGGVDPLFCESDGAFSAIPKYWEDSEVLAANVLHLEFAFWSQYTRTWDTGGDGGPEHTWDSARAGQLSASKNPRENFTLDLGPQSLTIPSDDVWPHYAQVTLVVDRSGDDRPDAVLAREISANDSDVPLMSVEHLPPVEDSPFVKIGSEWVEYRKQGSSMLQGVLRGRRGTSPAPHPAGTRVRVGKTVVITLKLACGRDCWNG